MFRRWIGYNGAIMVSSDGRGIYLFSLPVILSRCHKPIFIPWSEIAKILTRTSWHSAVYVIVIRRAPSVDFALKAGTFEFVRENAVRAGVKIAA